MKIATAQINATVGNILENLALHYRMIALAATHNVDLIVFPEMSITGYCRAEAKELALSEHDAVLRKLKELSQENKIIIVAGAPIKIKKQLHIGSFIFNPNNTTNIYTKQYLHGSEALYYEPSFNHNPIVEIEDEKIAFAICADIENSNHPKTASKNNSSLYMPSIFYSRNGINDGMVKLKTYAKKYALNILMSNFIGKHGEIEAGGKSAFFTANGELKAALSATKEGLLIIEKQHNNWSTETIEID